MALSRNFAANVRKRRIELRLTQKQLAAKMGVSHVYVAQIELEADQNRSLEVVERFAKALDCPPLHLLIAPEEVAAIA